MSYTEMFGIPKKGGELVHLQNCKNSWRGGMWIWNNLSNKYLGRDFNLMEAGDSKVWDLWKDSRLSDSEYYSLMSTFDKMLVHNDMMLVVADALEQFDPGTENLKLQAETLRQAKKDGMMAVCWNQTSVCADTWMVYDHEDDEDERMFNIDIDKEYGHQFMKTRDKEYEDYQNSFQEKGTER